MGLNLQKLMRTAYKLILCSYSKCKDWSLLWRKMNLKKNVLNKGTVNKFITPKRL